MKPQKLRVFINFNVRSNYCFLGIPTFIYLFYHTFCGLFKDAKYLDYITSNGSMTGINIKLSLWLINEVVRYEDHGVIVV
jgi:hypothetical protein